MADKLKGKIAYYEGLSPKTALPCQVRLTTPFCLQGSMETRHNVFCSTRRYENRNEGRCWNTSPVGEIAADSESHNVASSTQRRPVAENAKGVHTVNFVVHALGFTN